MTIVSLHALRLFCLCYELTWTIHSNGYDPGKVLLHETAAVRNCPLHSLLWS